MHLLVGLEIPSGYCQTVGVENRNLKQGSQERSGMKKTFHEKCDN